MEKINIEDQDKIKTLRNDTLHQLIELGKISMDLEYIKESQNILIQDYNNVVSTLKKLQESEENLIKELSIKYGEGATINLDTFEIINNKT